MGSLTNDAETKFLQHVLKGTSWTVSACYLALFTGSPGEAGGGTEVSGGSYARVQLDTEWPAAAASRSISNDEDIVFPTATASWGTVTDWAIFDASTAGNMIAYGSLSASKAISSGQTPKILSGQLTLNVPTSNGMTNYLANAMLDHLLAITAFTQPTNLYVGLGTAAFDDSGAFINEVADSGAYARVNHNSWDVSGNQADNNGVISFTTATGSWGTIGDCFIADSGTHGSGNMLIYGVLDSDFAVTTDDDVQFADAAFVITMD